MGKGAGKRDSGQSAATTGGRLITGHRGPEVSMWGSEGEKHLPLFGNNFPTGCGMILQVDPDP
jgi:hypothetical protein